MLDPSDPDERRLLVIAEHPELPAAIAAGQRELHVHGEPMSPELHIAMHSEEGVDFIVHAMIARPKLMR